MTTPVWQGGTLYPPGSLVQPASAPTPVNTTITNPGFESGDVDWDKGTGWTIGPVGPYQGANAAQFSFTGTSDITSAVFVAVAPGKSITCSVMVQQGASSSGQAGARVFLKWYDAANVLISESLGTQINDGSGGAWGQSTLTATAPANAAKVKIGARAFRSSGGNALWVDVFTWNYITPSVPTGLVYRAVQPVTGASASVEPVWPLTLGLTVVDGDVIWEAVQASRVTWEASPIFQSGGTEPDWPLRPGEFVIDGTFQWEAISRYIADERCPNTLPVAILATHVFAGDDDIIQFSAATNALDWTTPRDAGYLPSGLQQANSNEMAVLAPYRGNLAAFNASSFQLWQADPDPEAMYLLDQQDGIGSIWPRAAVAISSDLYYLAALGVRTVSQSAGNNSLNSGDVGMPIDTLVQEALTETVAAGAQPIAAYYPSLGQYLIAFPKPVSSSGWVPISESAVDYTFSSNGDAVFGGSTVSAVASGDSGFSFSLNSGDQTQIRFTSISFESTLDGELATFAWGGFFDPQSQSNTAPDPSVAFLPSPVEAYMEVTNPVSFSFVTEATPSFSFLVEVFVEGAGEESDETEVFVHTRAGGKGAWSRYVFPFEITEFALLGNDLYIRHGDTISKFDDSIRYDELSVAGTQVPFGGTVQWNYLDLGQPGTTKEMQGFDFIGTGVPSFSIGYDQRDITKFTVPYEIDPDTLPGGMIPLPVMAPAMSVKVTFQAGSDWSMNSVLLYVNDMGNGP